MSRVRRVVLLGALIVALAPSTSRAAVRLGLGADWWVDHGGVFELTLGVSTPLARNISIGGRFGGLFTTTATTFGVPLDLQLRVNLGRVYIEGLAGPWIFFGGDVLRGHVGVGFGIHARAVTFGLELGYLSPSPHAGLRLSWNF